MCQLASGGMGTVYVATRRYESGLLKPVAIKTIHSHLVTDPRFVRMFLAEARHLSRIKHSYVCRLLDVGWEELAVNAGPEGLNTTHVPYVAMEYLVGESLSRIATPLSLRVSELGVAYTAKMLAAVCEGLHGAHETRDDDDRELHIVHRDISPDNLFLLYDGSVRIVDFGIARAADTVRTTRPSAGPKGKFVYMPPEQLRCEAIDRRADVWSTGVVLWELLAGAPLMPRSTDQEVSRAVLEMPIPPPSSVNRHVPAELDAIVLRALQRDPDARYPSAHAFGSALEGFCARYFGTISKAALGRWLEDMFPNGKTFRQQIVKYAQNGPEALEHAIPLRKYYAAPDTKTQPTREGQTARRRRAIWGLGALSALLVLLASLLVPSIATTLQPLLSWTKGGASVPRSPTPPQPPLVALPEVQSPPEAPSSKAASEPQETLDPLPQETLDPLPQETLDPLPQEVLGTPPEPPSPRAKPVPKPEADARRTRARGTRTTKAQSPTAAPLHEDETFQKPSEQKAQRTGQVYVATPGAHVAVSLEGRTLGRTPTRITLPAGEHLLFLERETGAPLPVQVKVSAGQLVFVEVPIETKRSP